MTATLARIVFDMSGNLIEVIRPNDDSQLTDPSFCRLNAVWADVAANDYDACTNRRDELAAAQPLIEDAQVAALIAAEVQRIDDAKAAQAAADAASIAAWLAEHPDGTP